MSNVMAIEIIEKAKFYIAYRVCHPWSSFGEI